MNQTNTKRALLFALGIVVVVGFCLYLVAGWVNHNFEQNSGRNSKSRRLEELVSGLPLGANTKETQAFFGEPPHEISTDLTVLRGPRFMAVESSHEKPEPFELRIWQHGDRKAFVVFDKDGIAIGKWSELEK